MRSVVIAGVVATFALLVPAAAQANHRHVLVLDDGSCVILAVQGNEPFVTLPEESFNNTTEPTTTLNPHPLHVHVHRGQPGEVVTLAVYGSAQDPCVATGNYINGP